MKELFLCSSFKDVDALFIQHVHNRHRGQRVAFIATAAEVESYRGYVSAARSVFEVLGIEIVMIDVHKQTYEDIDSHFSVCDYIYVSGGNTFYLLQELRKHNIDTLIRTYVNAGKVYLGESAGSIIMGSDISYVRGMDDPENAAELKSTKGIGMVGFHILPHDGCSPFVKATASIRCNFKGDGLLPISNSEAVFVCDEFVSVLAIKS